MLSFEGVTAGLSRSVLVDVDWRLGEGETWAVVGPNGAGKSSLLRVLRGQLPITRGALRYGAHERGRALAADPSGQVLPVSFAAQAALLKGAAGFAQSRWHGGHDDAVARGRDVLGTALGIPRCRRLVDALELDPILERRVTELSNGERRKLQLVRAAAQGPAVLALDNPFNGLDRTSRETVVEALRRLHGEGMTIVVLTPRADEIVDAVTHVLLLEEGRVAAAGPRATVLADERPAEVVVWGARGVGPSTPGAGSSVGSMPAIAHPHAGSPASARSRDASDAPTESDPVVELRDVTVRYGEVPVLNGIGWTVRRGERWVVVGPNGAGKSALLSLILTDNPQAYANDVSLFGRRRGTGDSIWEIRRRIGCVSPEMHLYSGLSDRVPDVIGSAFRDPERRGGRPAMRKLQAAEEWLDALGVPDCRDRRFGELSEGERQLVLLGRALAKRPELLVLDEPCQGLDPCRRARFLDLLERELGASDTTLIYVTHDLEEVPTAVTRGLLLRRGRAAFEGSAREALEAHGAHGIRPFSSTSVTSSSM